MREIGQGLNSSGFNSSSELKAHSHPVPPANKRVCRQRIASASGGYADTDLHSKSAD